MPSASAAYSQSYVDMSMVLLVYRSPLELGKSKWAYSGITTQILPGGRFSSLISPSPEKVKNDSSTVSYTHLRAHETY